ncbi:MAG: ABC transporter ATP-binding protein [Desulfatibacillaceae bacterium]
MSAILEVRNLVKHYPGVIAVDGVSFALEPGVCFGLLGPNGAGKTTTIEIIEGLVKPTSGEVLYKGGARGRDFVQEVGIQFQHTALPEFLTVGEVLRTFANFYKTPMPLDSLAELCQLGDIMDRDNGKISGGQKQRLLLALALVNDPDLVFLDEPTTGLDPQARRNVWDIVEGIRQRGKTLVLTTHYLEEAQLLADDVAIMDSGRIIARGSPERLLRKHRTGVTVILPREAFAEAPDQDFARRIGEDGAVYVNGSQVEILATDVNACMRALLATGADLSDMEVRSYSLEDLFLELTGKKLRD